jgi:glutamate dehydrogenase/leucine dehydrogenase
VGGLVTTTRIATLSCRATCGGANNQLVAHSLGEELELAAALQMRGILYVPDWLASCGGTIHGQLEFEHGGCFEPQAAIARVRQVCGATLSSIVGEARDAGQSVTHVAVRRFQLNALTDD